MSYKCSVCGQKFKTSSGATSARHINSKKHKDALKSKIITDDQKTPNQIQDLLLFTLVQNSQNLTFSKILSVFSSFGIKTDETLRSIVKKINDHDLSYTGQIDSDYEVVLNKILKLNKISYPLTMSMNEISQLFHDLGFKYPIEFLDYFQKLNKKYPEFVGVSSSKIGEQPDLITFKNIFINKLTFHPGNRWEI